MRSNLLILVFALVLHHEPHLPETTAEKPVVGPAVTYNLSGVYHGETGHELPSELTWRDDAAIVWSNVWWNTDGGEEDPPQPGLTGQFPPDLI